MLTRTKWEGFEALKLENDRLSTIVVPELGGKIASLYDKNADHEWFAKPTNPPRHRTYGDTFTDYELCGWDEMFPTIVECPYPLDERITLPDHGEVWLLPWETNEEVDNSIDLSVEGKALAYTLHRAIGLQEQGLTLEYTLQNNSNASMLYMWAAHPLFAATEQTRILLPETVKQVVNVIADDSVLGAEGELHRYPGALDQIKAPTSKTCRKFYILPDEAIGWTGLQQLDKNCAITLSWNANMLPYCGVWVDEGMFTTQSTVAPEPSNGYYDSLVTAQKNERVATIDSHSTVRWSLDIDLKA